MEAAQLTSLLDFYKAVNQLVDQKLEIAIKNQPSDTFQSPEVNLLATALSLAQGAYLKLEFERVNVYTKTEYADLEAIINATRSALSENGISFTQQIDQGLGETLIYTKLIHTSGQWLSSRSRVIPIATDQKATDSAIQFAKRQAAMSLLGIAGRNDYADDDAVASNSGLRLQKDKGTAINRNYEPTTTETISKDQIAELDYELQGDDNRDLMKDIYDSLRVESLSDIPKDMYRDVINKVRSIKALRAGIKKH